MVESLEPNVFVMYNDLLGIHTMDNDCKCNFFLGGSTCFVAYQGSTYHLVDTLPLNDPKYKQVLVYFHYKIMYYIQHIF